MLKNSENSNVAFVHVYKVKQPELRLASLVCIRKPTDMSQTSLTSFQRLASTSEGKYKSQIIGNYTTHFLYGSDQEYEKNNNLIFLFFSNSLLYITISKTNGK